MEGTEQKPFGIQISEMAAEMIADISQKVDMTRLAVDRNYINELQEKLLKELVVNYAKRTDEKDLLVQIYFQITPDATPQLGEEEFCAGVCIENIGHWNICEHNLSYIRDFRRDNQFLKWWYYETIRMGVGGWTRCYYDPYLKRNVVTYSIPVYGKDGFLIGVLGIDVDYGDFKKLMQERLVKNIRKDIESIRMEHELIGECEAMNQQYLDVNTFEIISGDDIFQGMAAHSTEMEEVKNLILKASISDANVLLQGETGVGKDFVANFIHNKSKFSAGPMINVNCCALPEALMESEFFGYGKGAFTGAKNEGKAGYFEAADGGTVLLNEIGDLPVHLQAKLLNVIQEKKVMRIGETVKRKTSFRLMAATNKDLYSLVTQNKFREDLYYRLHVIPIYIPPLRRRREDIFSLLGYFLAKNMEKYQVEKRFSIDVQSLLLEYEWPGNIRELENVVERLVLTSNQRIITVEDLPAELSEKINAGLRAGKKVQLPSDVKDILPEKPSDEPRVAEVRSKGLKEQLEDAECQIIRTAYEGLGSSYKVAESLGISQTQAYKKMKKYGIC